jgi:hypothetical protein
VRGIGLKPVCNRVLESEMFRVAPIITTIVLANSGPLVIVGTPALGVVVRVLQRLGDKTQEFSLAGLYLSRDVIGEHRDGAINDQLATLGVNGDAAILQVSKEG